MSSPTSERKHTSQGQWQARFLTACVAFTGILAALTWTVDNWRFHRALKFAQADVVAQHYTAARDRLMRLAARYPAHGAVQYQLGVCEQALNRPDRAIRAWAAVPLNASEAPRAALARAKLLIHTLGGLTEAEPLLEFAIRGPADVANSACWELAQLFVWEGRSREARRLLEAGWLRAPARERVAYIREHWRLDSVAVAEEDVRSVLDAAARYAPEDHGCRLVRAALAVGYGRWTDAQRELDRCLAERPSDMAVWHTRLVWSIAVERRDEVERAIEHMSKNSLETREILQYRTWVAACSGDIDRERHLLELWMRLMPSDTFPIERLAALAQQSGNTDRASTLRTRKAEIDHRKEQYRWGLVNLPAQPGVWQAEALARLAETLGRAFEAHCWWTLVGVPSTAESTARVTVPHTEATLGALRSDLARWKGGRSTTSERKSTKLPIFTSERLGNFRYQSAPSARHQIPEVVGGGCALLDYDRDGWLDVFFVQGGTFPPADPSAKSTDRLYRNCGDGTFEDVSERSGIASLPGGFGFGVTAGDYDNDGDTDLVLTRWRSYALFRNRGNGTFEDATDNSGLGGDRGFPTSAALGDLDNDGDLDLYVCHYLQWDAANPPICQSARVPERTVSCLPRRFRAEPDRLFRNDKGHFVDVTEQAGINDEEGHGLGVVAVDLDGDGRSEIYVANDQSPNYLFQNRGGGLQFQETAVASGSACGADGVARAGMGVACGDLDRDGRPDLAVTNFFTESATFYRNLGSGMFSDSTVAIGLTAPTRFVLGFGIAFLDADNDGQLDLAMANGHVNDERPAVPYAMRAQLFHGIGGRLVDISDQAGPPWAEPVVGRGLAIGDLNNDGRVDVLVVPQNRSIIYARNVTAKSSHFITFRLEGTKSNSDGVGARITLEAGGDRQVTWKCGGGSYLSTSDPRMHFGLGAARIVNVVEVAWPSGHIDRFRDLPVDTGYVLREAAAAPAPLPGFARSMK